MKTDGQPMLTLAFGKSKADFLSINLVFFVDIFNKGLEVVSGFFRFFGFGGFSGYDRSFKYSTRKIIAHFRHECHRCSTGTYD